MLRMLRGSLRWTAGAGLVSSLTTSGLLASSLLASSLCTTRVAQADEGMWPYNHLPKAELLRKYNFDASDAWLEHVRRSSVRVGGCSASFVSGSGLTLTNHHCAQECISRLSTPEHDYMKQGFYAKTEAKELVCPGYSINQLGEITDVTARVQKATQGLDGAAFHQAFKAESARIEKECAKNDDLNCEVVSLYHGGLYELYQYRRYRDVRLVFAPELEMAFFGGDPDNFNFPRFDLDLSFLRAYVDGKPAPTPDHLAFSATALQPNDLTFVSGNPGTTQRLRTVAELEHLRDRELVKQLIALAQYRGFLNEYAERGAEARRVATSEIFGVENSYKALHGQHDALVDRAFFRRLVAQENRLRTRVNANPQLKSKYGGAWDAIARAEAQLEAIELELQWIEGPSRPAWAKSTLFTWARSLVRGAAERPKQNEERLEEFSDARLPGLEQRLLAPKPLNAAFETAKLAFGLTGLREALGADHPFVKKVLGKASPTELATALVKGSSLDRMEERKRLWQGGQAAILASKDAMIQLALRIDAEGRALRSHYENEIEAVLTKNSELVARARFEIDGMNSYPDATGSARLSIGTVRGWREPSTGKLVPSFTTIGGAFERATGRSPFALPKSWLDKQKELAEDTPFNFVSDNDIVGGNSGSPVINRQGDLVGLVFDGNIHSLGGTYGFDPAHNRAVAVDTRAIVEALGKIYGASRVVAEVQSKEK